MTNEELIGKIIKDDDEQAYTMLFDRIYDGLLKLAFYFVKDYQYAEDIVSDVFVNFLKRRDTIGSIDSVEAFFHTAIRNQSLKHIRKHKYTSTLMTGSSRNHHEIVSDSKPDQDLMDKELYDIISASLTKLPTQRRVIFELVKYEQLKYKEVAKILSISEKTVEKHMSAALKVVRKVTRDYLESTDINAQKKTADISFFSFFIKKSYKS